MQNCSFKWLNNTSTPIRICISNSLEPLLSHSHNETEFMYFYETTGGYYRCNERKILFSKENLLIVNPGEKHSCENWGEKCIAACIIIDTSQLSVSKKSRYIYNNIVSNQSINNYFYELKSLLENKNIENEEIEYKINAIIYNIMATLSHYKNIYPQINRKNYELNDVIDFIDKNISKDINVELLAKKCHLSKDRFSHLFKENIGMSPIKYITKERIKKACYLLKSTDLTIQKIAMDCNFSTSSYFSKMFFKYVGFTPKEYRNNN